jgi:tetratricopeptide (TPR) repeat protein
MGVADLFARPEVQRILDLTEKQLDYWERLELVCPRRRRRQRLYDFKDLIALRTVKQLTAQGVPAHRLRRSVVALGQKLREVRAPLTELRILSNGRDILVEQNGARLEPLSGQLVLNFETAEIGERVRVMPERGVEEWLALALELDADPATRSEAIQAYQRALEKDPRNSEALLNLGTLLYEQDELAHAAEQFRRAVQSDPRNALAHYNLGSLLDDLDQLDEARAHLEEAVRLDPAYPDAHYNLAFVLEELGAPEKGRHHWRRYVELDPTSPWADYARRRLDPAGAAPLPLPPRKTR